MRRVGCWEWLMTGLLWLRMAHTRTIEPVHQLCLTPQCIEASQTLQRNMNESCDPCEDFFEFSCGGWRAHHPVPATEAHWNQFNLVDEKLHYKIRDILEADEDSTDVQAINSAKYLYKACMNTVAIEKEGKAPLEALLASLGGWPVAGSGPPQRPWQDVLADVTTSLALSPILFIYVYADRKNTSQSVLTIDQPSLILPRSMLIDSGTYSSQRIAYKKWIIEAAILLSENSVFEAPISTIISQAEEILEFESLIAKITSPNEMRRNGFRTYNSMTLRQLQTWTDTASQNQISWLELMQKIFRGTNISIDWDERVVVREVDYLFNLARLIERTPPRTVVNYLLWRVVKAFSHDLNEKMRQLGFAFDQVFTGATQDHPRWKECVFSTNNALNMAVGYSYVEKHFDHSAKKVAFEMSNNIKKVFSEEISKVSWMDEKTKMAAQYKVTAMSQLIGYPHWYTNKSHLDVYYQNLKIGPKHFENVVSGRKFSVHKMLNKLRLPLDRKEWPISPAVVNAYYNPQINSIIFPAGILQTPFFSKGRIEALNYGGIGVVIGHEITHGFDDVGRQSDAFGNLAQWWSENTIKTYLEKAQCFIDQYGSFRVPQLDKTLSTQVTVNGVTTLGENIADNGGLHSALLAYNKYVEEKGEEPRLPGLEQYSAIQLFFIAFATNWCESTTKESLLNEILSDPHSPHKFRVQGSLRNSVEFTKAFNCPHTTHNTCKIW